MLRGLRCCVRSTCALEYTSYCQGHLPLRYSSLKRFISLTPSKSEKGRQEREHWVPNNSQSRCQHVSLSDARREGVV